MVEGVGSSTEEPENTENTDELNEQTEKQIGDDLFTELLRPSLLSSANHPTNSSTQ